MANIGAFSTWSATAASNQPDSTDSNTIQADLQAIQAGVRSIYTQGTIASATTTDLSTKTEGSLAVSGTTTITSFGTVSAGIRKVLKFDGALTLTYNATSLILPTNANIVTVAGDTCEVESLGSGNWRVNWYQRDSGDPLGVTAGSVTYAMLQDISATSRVLGRKTAGAGDTEELTFSEVLDFVGSAAQGDIMYRGASSWARLGAGTSGQYLKTNGAGANPEWAAGPGSMTLLGTINTTSGSSVSLSGLTLTTYTSLYIEISGVSPSSTDDYITFYGANIVTPSAGGATVWDGIVLVSLTSGSFGAMTARQGADGSGWAGDTTLSTASTEVTFGLAGGGTFDAGTIKIWGVK